MSLSNAVSSLQLSEDRVSKLALARHYVEYIISGDNKQRFERIHGESTTETWVATFSGKDLTFRLRNRNRDGQIVFGPPQRVLTQRDVYVHADPWRCTVNIQQVDVFSDGMLLKILIMKDQTFGIITKLSKQRRSKECHSQFFCDTPFTDCGLLILSVVLF